MKKLISSLVAVMVASSLFGARYYVSTSGSDDNNGTSWKTPYKSIQKAIDSASASATWKAPSEVWVAKGTYKEGKSISMGLHVKMYGGFAGTETKLEERIANQENASILDGESKYRVIENNAGNIDPDDRLIPTTCVLDGFTIQNGSFKMGAGVYNLYASPTISNCIFKNNEVTSEGGAMYNTSSSVNVVNCTFISNYAQISGGAIYNGYDTQVNEDEDRETPPMFTNCTFYQNSSNNRAGAVINDGESSKPVFVNCTFYGNTATLASQGGAVYNLSNAKPSFINCIFWGDKAAGSTNEIANASGTTAVVENCTVEKGYTGGKNIFEQNPALSELTYNGGFVPTMEVPKGSPVIAVGVAGEYVPTFDARNSPRAEVVTLGAFERFSAAPVIEVQPQATVKLGEKSTLTLEVFVRGDDDADLKYQWQQKTKEKGAEFEDIVGNASAKTAKLQVPNISADQNGWQYKCVVTDRSYEVESKVSTLTVLALPEIEVVEKSTLTEAFDGTDSAVKDKDCKFKIAITAKGATPITYQWQESSNDGTSWTDISVEENKTANKATFQSNRMIASNGDFKKLYRVKVMNPATEGNSALDGEAVYSEVFSITRLYPASVATPLPVSFEANEGGDVLFTGSATAESGSNVKYKWEVCQVGKDPADPKNWKSAGTKATLELKKVKVALSGNLYRYRVSNAGNPQFSEPSNVAVLKVYGKPTVKSINASVKNVWENGEVKLSAEVSPKAVELVFEWRVSYDKGKTWAEIGTTKGTAETASTFTHVPNAEDSGEAQYMCVVQCCDNKGKPIEGFVTSSKTAKVAVYEKARFNGYTFVQNKEDVDWAGANLVLAYAEYPFDMTANATGYKLKYQWQVCRMNGSEWGEWENIKGATKATYKFKKLVKDVDDAKYRCVVINDDNVNAPLAPEEFELVVQECPFPVAVSGYEYIADVNGNDARVVFVDKSNVRIAYSSANIDVAKPTYSYKRLSPTSADFSLKYKEGKTSYTLKGILSYDDISEELYGTITDSKNGLSLDVVLLEGNINDATSVVAKADVVNYPIETVYVKASAEDVLQVSFIDTKKCNVSFAEYEGEATYTYKDNKNGILTYVITINNKVVGYSAKLEVIAEGMNNALVITRENADKSVEVFYCK